MRVRGGWWCKRRCRERKGQGEIAITRIVSTRRRPRGASAIDARVAVRNNGAMSRPSTVFGKFGGVMRYDRRNVLKLGVSGAIAGWSGGLAGVANAQATITARIGHLEAASQPRHKGLENV